jgi:Icc-related predicted phosphoesterase
MALLTFCAVSDIHERLEWLRPLADDLAAVDWILLLGDLTQFGHAAEARVVVDAFRAVNPNVLAVPGNLDHPDVLAFLEDEGISLHGRHRILGDVGLAGAGGSSPTPFGTPFELPDAAYRDLLAAPLAAIAGARHRLLISHPPPRDTAVDRVRLGLHAGSATVRRLAEEHAPALLLCGHIHEGTGEDRIGSTRVFNPGPFRGGGHIRIEAGDDGLSARLVLPSSP